MGNDDVEVLEQRPEEPPFTVTFDRDDLTVTFRSTLELAAWFQTESEFWRRLIDGQQQNVAGGVINNLNLLTHSRGANLQERLTMAAGTYRPSAGSLGVLVSRITSSTAAAVAFAEAINPGSMSWQNNPDFNEGRTFASVYRALGGRLASQEKLAADAKLVENNVEIVEALRAGDQEALSRFANLISKCEEDWRYKIDGFEAKVALHAPRVYWRTRARQHRLLGKRARAQWFYTLLGTAAVVLAAVMYALLHSATEEWQTQLVTAGQRIFVLPTRPASPSARRSPA